MKYLSVNLTKHVQNMYTENWTALMKNQIRYNKQKDMFCSWIERPGKRPVLPKLVIQV